MCSVDRDTKFNPVIGAVVSLLLAAAAFLLYRFDPEEAAVFPRCLFLVVTGYECPGCGTQRALHHLFHLELSSAFSENGLILFLLPYLLLGGYLAFFNGNRQFPGLARLLFGKRAAIIVVSLILLYWVARNL